MFLRKSTDIEKEEALRNGNTFSISEIEDVLELIKNKQYPDGRFSDNECCLYSVIKNVLDISC